MPLTRRIILSLCALTLACTAMPLRSEPPAASYSFAVVPQFDQRKLFSIWQPIVEEVARRSGVPLQLTATLSVTEFERELARGTFDFTYTNPYHIYRESRRQGYLPLVRDETPLKGILVVRKESPVTQLSQLNGGRLAVPSANAIGASLLLRAELERNHGVRMEMLDVKTHSSVYLHVANGLVDAGGGVQKTLAEQPAPVRDALRILHTTAPFASHPISAHPRVAATVREAVRKALLEMAATPEGARLLGEVPVTRLVSASIDDYEPMRALDLESYWVEGSK